MKFQNTTVKINYSEKDLQSLMEAGYEKITQAVGRLVSYGMWSDNPPQSISISIRDGEMIASYSDEQSQHLRPFVMGAVWRQDEKRFTFHS